MLGLADGNADGVSDGWLLILGCRLGVSESAKEIK